MSDDSRDVQSKFDRPAAGTGGLPGPALPAAPTVPAAPADAAPVATALPVAPAAAAAPAPATPTAPVAVAVAPTAAAPVGPPEAPAPAAASDADAYDDVDDDTAASSRTLADRLRRLSPALVILTAGSIGSLLFMARAVTSHSTPVAVLMSVGVVTGLIFGADSVISSIATYRASKNGEGGRAVLLALVGGVSAVICAGAFAGTAVMVLVLNS